MTGVRRCPAHGFVTGEPCPRCGGETEPVLSAERRTRLSKFLSGALRHFPADAGLSLDRAGWTDWDGLVGAAERQYGWATPEHVRAVVETDPKGRFERGGDRVRAAYGHSVEVDLDASAAGGGADDADPPATDADHPATLYHGTAPRTLDAILTEGLKPMGRQAVHLSPGVAEAREVGARHADDPVVLVVDAAGLRDAGHAVRRRGQVTYTVDRVPPEYLSVADDGRVPDGSSDGDA